MMAVFADDVSAARAAIDIQASVGRLNGSMPAQRRMALRVGINRGEIIQQGDTFYGDGVNLAARVMALANAGQICLSERVFERVEDQIECGYAYLGKQAYKNIERKVPTYRMRLAPEAVGTITTERVHRARNYRWQFLAALLLLAVASALGGYLHLQERALQEQNRRLTVEAERLATEEAEARAASASTLAELRSLLSIAMAQLESERQVIEGLQAEAGERDTLILRLHVLLEAKAQEAQARGDLKASLVELQAQVDEEAELRQNAALRFSRVEGLLGQLDGMMNQLQRDGIPLEEASSMRAVADSEIKTLRHATLLDSERTSDRRRRLELLRSRLDKAAASESRAGRREDSSAKLELASVEAAWHRVEALRAAQGRSPSANRAPQNQRRGSIVPRRRPQLAAIAVEPAITIAEITAEPLEETTSNAKWGDGESQLEAELGTDVQTVTEATTLLNQRSDFLKQRIKAYLRGAVTTSARWPVYISKLEILESQGHTFWIRAFISMDNFGTESIDFLVSLDEGDVEISQHRPSGEWNRRSSLTPSPEGVFMGPEPPLVALEGVERYLIDHQSTLASEILAYEKRERVIATESGAWNPLSRVIIHDVKIVRLQGLSVQLRITYEVGVVAWNGEVMNDTLLFDAEWVDGEMQIVGHEYLDRESEADGRWRAKGGNWEMEILIAGESVRIDATCAGIAPMRGEGVIRNGRIEVTLGLFGRSQMLVAGTLERLLVTSTDFTCLPAELSFQPVRSELSLNSTVQE